MAQFFSFNKMITPTIIKAIFVIGVIVSILMGLGEIITGIASPFGGGLQVVMGLFTIIIGPLLTRVYCEILIVIFKINDNLQQINEKLSGNTNQD